MFLYPYYMFKKYVPIIRIWLKRLVIPMLSYFSVIMEHAHRATSGRLARKMSVKVTDNSYF